MKFETAFSLFGPLGGIFQAWQRIDTMEDTDAWCKVEEQQEVVKGLERDIEACRKVVKDPDISDKQRELQQAKLEELLEKLLKEISRLGKLRQAYIKSLGNRLF